MNVPPDGPLLAPAVAVEGETGADGDGVLHLVPAPGPQPHQVVDCDVGNVGSRLSISSVVTYV